MKMLTKEQFDAYYSELDNNSIPVAVAMPNKATRREYTEPTESTIASMKYTRNRLDEVIEAGA